MSQRARKGVRGVTSVREKQLAVGSSTPLPSKFHDIVDVAEQSGLLSGARTQIVRGRMPKALVERAKQRTGVTSETKLIELALATVAVADDYPDWLLAQRRRVNKDLDLEF